MGLIDGRVALMEPRLYLLRRQWGHKLYSWDSECGEVVRFKVISDYANSTVSNIVNLL